MQADNKTLSRSPSTVLKEKVVSASELGDIPIIFNIQMTVTQAHAITRLLPKHYSLQIDRVIRTKRTTKKNFFVEPKSKDAREIQDVNSINYESMRYEAEQNLSYNDVMRRCEKILSSLKKNRNSWPFLEPVDPIAMAIPHYKNIIPNPMDLQTVSQKLNEGAYNSLNSFYADIDLIISNSLIFNASNPQFCKITNDFRRSFEKLKVSPVNQQRTKPMAKKSQRKQKSQSSKIEQKKFLTIAEKKELALEIKSLPLKNIKEVAEIVCQGPVPESYEFNLEKLTPFHLREIQRYLDNRKREENNKRIIPNIEDEESSFHSDSDS